MGMKTFIRRADRHSVSMRGWALSAARDTDVTVSNLSYSGCQLRSGDEFETGEIVELRIIKRGAVSAEIRWADRGRAGVRFLS